MCGIIGIATSQGHRPPVVLRDLEHARDMMAHRGPDGAGLWDGGHVLLGHRRLAVIDPTPAGHQPMTIADARGNAWGTIVYNGELYNDAQLRRTWADPAPWRTRCDTETLARWLGRATGSEGGGASAAQLAASLMHVRGMYAFGYVDGPGHTLVLARDPMGIKPLYVARGVCHADGMERAVLLFASELPALLALRERALGLGPAPDVVGVSAYLSTIRTTMGRRTLFAGVEVVEPGEVLRVDLRDARLPVSRAWVPRLAWDGPTPDDATIASAIEQSVQAHLRSDVPLCVLLSGGLDSTIIAACAVGQAGVHGLRSFCAGYGPGAAAHAGVSSAHQPESPDFAFAREAAAALGTRHNEAGVDAEHFRATWAMMVDRLGVPLSTPNETAIYTVCRALRDAGCVVTLSGEGADELFAGYDLALDAALRDAQGNLADPSRAGERALLHASWIAPSMKAGVLSEQAWRACEQDGHLLAWANQTHAELASVGGDAGQGGRGGLFAFGTALRWLERVNLTGLLQRLDTASMLAGVEGRTPFADVRVRALAGALPPERLFAPSGAGEPRTKLALRRAFAARVPAGVLTRAKASFPLPFQGWMGEVAPTLDGCESVRELLSPQALALVRSGEAGWAATWPILNIALWCRRWWG